MASQCGAVSTKFLQWHSSVGLFQLSFSSGVPVYPTSNRWVAQWYPSVHWVNQWHSSVHWTSQCTLAQGKFVNGILVSTCTTVPSESYVCITHVSYLNPSSDHHHQQQQQQQHQQVSGSLCYYGSHCCEWFVLRYVLPVLIHTMDICCHVWQKLIWNRNFQKLFVITPYIVNLDLTNNWRCPHGI